MGYISYTDYRWKTYKSFQKFANNNTGLLTNDLLRAEPGVGLEFPTLETENSNYAKSARTSI